MTTEKAEKWLKSTVHDIFMDMCYYNRKNDEDMDVQKLRDLMDEGIISKEMMIDVFTKQIENEYPDNKTDENSK